MLDKDFEESWKRFTQEQVIANEIRIEDPTIPYVTAIIMAGDRLSKEKATKRLKESGDFHFSSIMVGSFARLDWAVEMMDQGLVSRETILDNLPDLWADSDPDDTNPRFLDLWKEAYERNNRRYVQDEAPIPSRSRYITIYRGQDKGAKFGIAWTLNHAIARKFADGAATRQSNRGGIVYITRVERAKVLGYLTGRGESEVIVDPSDLVFPTGSEKKA